MAKRYELPSAAWESELRTLCVQPRGRPGVGAIISTLRVLFRAPRRSHLDQMLPRVQRRLAGALDNEDGGILGWLVGGKGARGAGVFLASEVDAALDDRRLETQ